MARRPLHDRLFRSLLRLFPAEFRGDFGDEMAEDFGDQRREAARGGVRSVERLWLRTFRDMAARAPREHADILRRDAGYALRLLRRRPSFTATVLLTLAIGIGLNSAIFSVVHAVLWRELPYPASDRLVRLYEVNPKNGALAWASSANFLDWRAQTKTLEALAIVSLTNGFLIAGGHPQDVQGMRVTEDFFAMLGARPALGRVFELHDFDSLRATSREAARLRQPARPAVAVLSHAAWQQYLNGRTDVIGQTVKLDGAPVEVTGVMPPDFDFSEEPRRRATEFWIPQVADPIQRRARYLVAIGRLGHDVSLGDAQAEFDVIAGRLSAVHAADNAGWGVRLQPLRETMTAPVQKQLWFLLAAVICVLLVACANVTNLLLTHASGRRRELAMRVALGASRAQLVRQTLTEGLVLGVLGGVAGFLLAFWAVPAIVALAPPNIPRLREIGVDVRVLFFTTAVSVGAGIASGLAACLSLNRLDPKGALRGAGVAPASGRRFRQALTVVEVALALMLVVAAALLVRTMRAVNGIELGFDPANVISIGITPDHRKLGGRAGVARFETDLLERLQALPGVTAAGVGMRPLNPSMTTVIKRSPDHEGVRMAVDTASPGFLPALGAQLVRGRFFSATDTAESPRIAILNETATRLLWHDDDPIGKWIDVDGDRLEVVGVVGDVRRGALEAESVPAAYIPHTQSTRYYVNNVLVRTVGAPRALLPAVRTVMRELDPEQAVTRVFTLEEVLRDATAPRRFSLQLVGLFALLSLGLAGLGIYGVVAESVAQRVPEIGIRMALGAAPADVIRMVLSHGTLLVGCGLALGALGAFALRRTMASLVFGVPVTDPLAYVAACVCLGAATFVACAIPAARAARIDPVIALRAE